MSTMPNFDITGSFRQKLDLTQAGVTDEFRVSGHAPDSNPSSDVKLATFYMQLAMHHFRFPAVSRYRV